MDYLQKFRFTIGNERHSLLLPLSVGQYDIWTEQQLYPNDFSNHSHFAAKICEWLDVEVFKNAVSYLSERHEVIRTIFPIVKGIPVRHVLPASEIQLNIEECTNLTDDEIRLKIKKNFEKTFDLLTESPYKFFLYKRSFNEYFLQIIEHHIAVSMDAYVNLPIELANLYVSIRDKKEVIFKNQPATYSSFIEKQYETFDTDRFKIDEKYWRNYLSGNLPTPLLPFQQKKTTELNECTIKIHRCSLNTAFIYKIKEISSLFNVTTFSLLSAAFQALLHLYTKQEEVIVGIPNDTRRGAYKDVIGYTANSLPLRSKFIADEDFTTFLRKNSSDIRKMIKHRLYPLTMIMNNLRKENGNTFSELFKILIVSQKSDEFSEVASLGAGSNDAIITIDGFTYKSIGMGVMSTGRFDLAVAITETTQEYVVSFHYNESLFKEETIQELADSYLRLLDNIVDNPYQKMRDLSLLSDDVKSILLNVWNQTAIHFEENGNFIDWFEKQAYLTPKATAIIFEGKEINYETLNNLANQAAHYIRKLGATTETLIGVGLTRSINLITSLLGIMKVGSAFLPLDSELPKKRLQFMLEDSQAEILITDQSCQNIFECYQGKIVLLDREQDKISKEKTCSIERNEGFDHLAYVIYTSGSTGKPKGVEICQKSLNNLLLAIQHKLNISAQDRWLALTTISFDISILEILLPLSQGATIVLANSSTNKDPFLLSRIFENDNITVAQATPAMWQMLVDFGWKGSSSLTILCGGEALSKTLAHKLISCSHVLWNMYGPTETTIWSSTKKISNSEDKITIGRPILNTTFYILDEGYNLLPIGMPGELYIGGMGVARGYRNRLQLTAERFIQSSFPDTNRLYRTGDLARFLPNGEVEYLGRLDNQVKIRGYRIELGEIEEALKKCSGIQDAIVSACDEKTGSKQLVAYFKGNTDEREIRHTLCQYLPSYMIPSAFVQLTQFPLSPNGKVDRASLPMLGNIFDKADYISPTSSVEKEIAKVFEDLLQIEKISIDAHFFSIGGHSLLAAQAITRINSIFHINLSLKTLFDKPTISLLAIEVELKLKAENSTFLIPRIAADTKHTLSFSQQRFLFLDQQTHNSAAYNIPFVLDITGELDLLALQKALDMIVQRHELLRTIFKEAADDLEQFVLHEVSTKIRYEDCSSSECPEENAISLTKSEASKPFDLTTGPLFRFLLIRKSKKKYALFLNFHHIIFDGHSINIFTKELKKLYENYIINDHFLLPELKIQYKDYAHWQCKGVKKSLERPQLSRWLKKLNDAPQILDLPCDKPRPTIQTYNGALFDFLIVEPNVVELLKNLAKENDSTLFLTLLSVFHVFLYRYTGQSDFVIGIPVSVRTHKDLEDLIGCFINTLPLRVATNGERSFSDLMKSVKETFLDAFENQDVPLEKIIDRLKIERSPSHTPLFQVMFNMQPEIGIDRIGKLQVRLQNVERNMAHVDLSLSIQETYDGLKGTFEYNTDLFRKESIERMARHFQKLVCEILQNPGQNCGKLPMLLDEEIQQQVIEWNKQPLVYSTNGSILQLIEKWAENTPDAIAIVCKGKKFSYSQINKQANRIAHALLQLGIKPEDKVPIYLERSAEFITAVLGILKAGGAYIPLDPTQPKERVTTILQDLQPLCILTHSTLNASFFGYHILCIDSLPILQADNPSIYISKDQLAYIIYTSGSTGKPKGVEIDYNSINDRVFWKCSAYPLYTHDVLLHTYSFIFDGSIINYFWPLCAGASLVIATNEEQFDSIALIHLIQKHAVTTMDLLPSLLHNLLEEAKIAECFSLRNVFSGGEALSGSIVHLFYKKCSNAKLHNTYGPTEATVEASVWECKPDNVGTIAPIGKQIAGACLYILDQNQNIVPIGVKGELYIGGIGLARGYYNDITLTKEKFIQDPFSVNPKARLYRTGDIAKYSDDGNIEFLGRIDNQVKIRGYRIDLKEIEHALRSMDLVEHAVVSIRGDELHKHLVAYIILSTPSDAPSFFRSMKHYLSERLPAYMIPLHAVLLENFPTLPNGKIDFHKLPTPLSHANISPSSSNECKNDLERQLLAIWKIVLGLEDISLMDNFFDLGGNSLLAMRLVTRIKNEMGLAIPLIQLFQYPTIESFSDYLNVCNTAKSWSPIICMQPKGDKEPFFCVHPVGGSIFCYHALAKNWKANRPFYAIQAKGLEEGQIPHESIAAMAKEYIRAILKMQPLGPYFIGGWSYGGLIAAEIVRQLQEQGEEVSVLALIDTTANIENFNNIDVEDESLLLSELTNHLITEPQKIKSRLSFKEKFVRFIENGGKRALKKGQKNDVERLLNLAKANYRALKKFSIPSLDVNVVLIKSESSPEISEDMGWSKYVTRLKIFKGPGDHWAITRIDHAAQYAKLLQMALNPSSEEGTPKLALTNQQWK